MNDSSCFTDRYAFLKRFFPLFVVVVLCMGTASAQERPQLRAQGATEEMREVLSRASEKCQSIRGGHYEMEFMIKYMSGPDTNRTAISCDFRKMPEDTLFGKAFSLRLSTSYGIVYYLYTGKELVDYCDSTGSEYDGKGRIYSTDSCADRIISMSRDVKFYHPLTNDSFMVVLPEKFLGDSAYSVLMKDTLLDGKPCSCIDFLNNQNEESMGVKFIRYEFELWIDKEGYMPIQYAQIFEGMQGLDTMTQYDCYRLKSFTPELDTSRLRLESVPSHVTLTPYKVSAEEAAEEKEPELLRKGMKAPDWALPSMDGDTVRLADLKGKVVLIDFFYKSCAPCCAAMPALQRLHEKYKDRGLVVVGIDPYNDPEKDKMADFLSKRGITYTVLFSDLQLPQDYHVSGYPTMYIVNRRGKIAATEVGYGESMEESLEKVLKKLL